ncbi:MAG: bifunctional riboflavin kinase/FAD synthetase [Flavitalea sp.]
MKVHHYSESLQPFNKTVLTIGTFDGVHLGHQKILAQLVEEATKIGGESAIITFHPHPRRVINTESSIQLINNIEERIELIHKAGIEHVVIVPFTESFSMLSAAEYVEEFLVKKFNPHTIIIGYDHHFGHGRQGNYKMLEDYQSKGYFELKEIPEHLINNNTVSATSIRNALLEGNIEEANKLLGYDFYFTGKVVPGDKLGRTIGYPTANLEIKDKGKIVPSNGVYAVSVKHHGRSYKGMMNIGMRPTVQGTTRRIEVNIFDFDKDIYDQDIRVEVHSFIRNEKKFSGLDELKEQLKKDKEEAIRLFR